MRTFTRSIICLHCMRGGGTSYLPTVAACPPLDSKHQLLSRQIQTVPFPIVALVQSYDRRILYYSYAMFKILNCGAFQDGRLQHVHLPQSMRATMAMNPLVAPDGKATPIVIIVSGETSTAVHGPTL